MFGIGTGEILLILVIAMMVVGPERMVKFARDAGRMLAQFRQQTESMTKEFREALAVDEIEKEIKATMEELPQGEEPAASEAPAGQSASPPVASGTLPPNDTSPAPSMSRTPALSSHIQAPFIDSETRIGPSYAADTDGSSGDHAEWELPTVIRVGELVPENDEEAEPISIDTVAIKEEGTSEQDVPSDEDG